MYANPFLIRVGQELERERTPYLIILLFCRLGPGPTVYKKKPFRFLRRKNIGANA